MDSKPYPADIATLEAVFIQQLHGRAEMSMQYEDAVLQTQAISVMPVDALKREAAACLPEDERCNSEALQEALILPVCHWFRSEFFSWVDKPACPQCSKADTALLEKTSVPTPSEQADGAGRVEEYRCDGCHAVVRFPRYNNPGKLLQTRRGRCGEWANCLTLCLRALGFETRLAHDWTDHVWTEVWSARQRRWLHCDSCEGGLDRPLLYETGWGKKLTYVIASSAEEVVDVTWRYSLHHKAVLARRLSIREWRLIDVLQAMNSRRRAALSPARRRTLDERSVRELCEMLNPRLQVRDGGERGRVSGSYEWRRQRGELGADAPPEADTSTVVRVEAAEKQAGELLLTYSCGTDTYARPTVGRTARGWQSWAFASENVFRKEERDWRKAYVARRDGAAEGAVSWKFDLAVVDVAAVHVRVDRCVFGNGSVNVACTVGQQSWPVDEADLHLDGALLRGAVEMTVAARLAGGVGDVAYQHAQLFRTDIDSETANLSVRVRFK